ncbi:MAG: GNAT family N-acetyltransferase [Anaerolineae bacterium]|nr:GNAT family N-acetyltransferase [Anaerolineae bacterium]
MKRGEPVKTLAVVLRRASAHDCDQLASMNLELIRDEGSRNPMTQIELSERMRRWLKNGWDALLIVVNKAVVGYILYQIRPDEYYPEQRDVYVRQYFIKRPFRSKGIGQKAFQQIQADYFPPDAALVVDVLATNPGARRFWEKLGFASYAENLRLEKRGSSDGSHPPTAD